MDALGRLFFDPRMVLNVPALTHLESNQLFNELAGQFRLAQIDLTQLEMEEFKRQVLQTARGTPGEIVEMCKLAEQPRYHHGSHIKFAPLRIDALINLGVLDKRQRLRMNLPAYAFGKYGVRRAALNAVRFTPFFTASCSSLASIPALYRSLGRGRPTPTPQMRCVRVVWRDRQPGSDHSHAYTIK